jgi:hypothetical protein
MSSSSRSIAAARQKRASEQSSNISTSRPVTSISSQSVFAQQYQQQNMHQNISVGVGNKNVRVSQSQSKMQQPSQTQLQNENASQLSKISIPNAIGLITLRLGKLEQFIQETHSAGGYEYNNESVPSNMKLVTDEVFDNIVNRLTLLESKTLNSDNYTERIQVMSNELVELKNVVRDLSISINSFVHETNEKFIDFEGALAEIEKNFEVDNIIGGNGDICVGDVNIENTTTLNENENENVNLQYEENIENTEITYEN